MMLKPLMVVAAEEHAYISRQAIRQRRCAEWKHTVIVRPPAAAVAGMEVVAVPVARVDDMMRSGCR